MAEYRERGVPPPERAVPKTANNRAKAALSKMADCFCAVMLPRSFPLTYMQILHLRVAGPALLLSFLLRRGHLHVGPASGVLDLGAAVFLLATMPWGGVGPCSACVRFGSPSSVSLPDPLVSSSLGLFPIPPA